MKKSSPLLAGIFMLGMLIACGSLTSTPLSTIDKDAVATIVAATLSAIPSATSAPSPTVTSTPEPPTVLPQSLYYWAGDFNNGMGQIYRLSRDGSTITQITNEPAGAYLFDISPLDGTIAYQSNHKLLSVNANGENRRVLVEGQVLYGPVWSPDEKYIAYSTQDGLYFYSMETGVTTMVLANTGDNPSYLPQDFSPDGSKLIVRRRGHDFVYDIASHTSKPILLPPWGFSSLNHMSWLADSKQIFSFSSFAGGISYGITNPGLYRINVENGSGEALLWNDNSGKPMDCVEAPIQTSDGHIIYLYGTELSCGYPNLSLVRSASDAVTDRVVLRPETFHVADAVWTPDKNALVILQNTGFNNRLTNLILVPLNPNLPVVTLLADASKLGYTLRWGQP